MKRLIFIIMDNLLHNVLNACGLWKLESQCQRVHKIPSTLFIIQMCVHNVLPKKMTLWRIQNFVKQIVDNLCEILLKTFRHFNPALLTIILLTSAEFCTVKQIQIQYGFVERKWRERQIHLQVQLANTQTIAHVPLPWELLWGEYLCCRWRALDKR